MWGININNKVNRTRDVQNHISVGLASWKLHALKNTRDYSIYG